VAELVLSAAGHEIIRQRQRNLTQVQMTPGLLYESRPRTISPPEQNEKPSNLF
jgi:hypothetical protein